MAIDPICGMLVDEASALQAERNGQTFWFCCDACRQKFLATPANEKPVAGSCGCCQPAAPAQKQACCSPAKAVFSSADRVYGCPMHADILRQHPGNCPKCGMALESKQVAAGVR